MMYTIHPNKKNIGGSDMLTEASLQDLRVLLCLWEIGKADVEQLTAAACVSKEDVRAALAFWRGAGMVCRAEDAKPCPPPIAEAATSKTGTSLQRNESITYTAEELAQYTERHKLHDFYTACQQVVKRELGRVEMNSVVYLLEQLHLETDYILMLLTYCAEQGVVSFRYLEKRAISLVEQGITTYTQLDSFIENERAFRSVEGKIRRMFGMGERKPTARERSYLEKWINSFGYRDDIIGIAYDITANNTGKASMDYADKLLSTWHLAGCKTEAQVSAQVEKDRLARLSGQGRALAASREKGKGAEAPKPVSFDPTEAFAKALERSYGAAAPANNKTDA